MSDVWTDQERQQLVEALKDGRTFTQISAMLGRSRNSVAGRVMRDADLGIAVPGRRTRSSQRPVHTPVQKLSKKEPAPSPPKEPRKKKPEPPEEEPPPRGEPYRPSSPRPAPDSLNVPLLELRPGMCKWPVHETPTLIGGFAFCAAPVAWHGAPYCAFHQDVAAPAARLVRA